MARQYAKDMIGKRYGRLVVLDIDHYEYNSRGYKRTYLRCKCDCGNEKVIIAYSLSHGYTASCGCLNKESLSKTATKHGKSNTRIYHIYKDMLRRCNDPKRKTYPRYGGRGIKVCPEWEKSFEAFYEWSMANGYSDELTIDRKDNDKGYSPDNCRWVTYTVQANNTSWNTLYTYNGETHTIAEWARGFNIPYNTFNRRLFNGWDFEEAAGIKEHKIKNASEVLYTINGETHNIKEWCKLRNLSVDTVRYRREHNWTPEEIFGFKEHKVGRNKTNK